MQASAAGEDIPVQIVADPRLNKIFIMGRPVDIVFVEGLVRAFDAPPNRNSFFKRKLRFIIASDFLQVAADALEAHNGTTSDSARRQGNSELRPAAQSVLRGHQTVVIGGIPAVVMPNPLRSSMSVMFLSRSSLGKPLSSPIIWQIAFSFKGRLRVCALSPS